jgi:chromate transporter
MVLSGTGSFCSKVAQAARSIAETKRVSFLMLFSPFIVRLPHHYELTRPARVLLDKMNQPAVSFAEAFRFWLKLGFISFGGPTGQIAIMHQELVERRRWISEYRFLHALNYCMLLPGPEAQQLATYIGWLMHRTWGGIVAGALFVLPSLLILIALTWIYLVYGDQPAIAGVLFGIKPAVTAIVLFAAYRIGSRVLKNPLLWPVAAAAFVAIFAFKIPFPYIVLGAAVIGFIGGRVAPDQFVPVASHGPTHGSDFLIADSSPTPEHCRFSGRKFAMILAVCLTLWAAAILLLRGDETLSQMAWFFTKAALLTFGGAYAVLPYVYQGAVENFQWLNATQMIDGLALGETTPGPLIMIVAFVGFVGAWTKELFGPDALFAAGAAGATVTTFFTFLPSFLFILAGGPLVEATHGEIKFTAPLTAITAAIVGVIVNLAMFFAYHVLWPDGFAGNFEWLSALIGIAAFVALTRYKVGIIPVIAACGAAGFLTTVV